MRLLTGYLLGVFLLIFAVSACENNSTGSTDVDNTDPEEQPIPEEDLEWTLVWSDEFESETIDESKWSFQFGTGADEGLDRWGNNELQYYTDRPENAYIEDDKLHIVALNERFEGMNYTSARIRTKEKGDWQFGRIEILAKLPEGQGIWPAVWMLPTDEIFGGWPKSGEIDIMELVGHQPSTIHGTVHFGPDWPNNQFKGNSYSLSNEKFSDDFHLFSIEWEQNKITWYVDGNEFYSVTPATLQPHQYPFNARFHLIMNLAVGGIWPGNPDSTTEFPQSLVVDYIRVYQLQ